ncbi:DUF3817 domain-containing protein [Euzebyella marina]|uniref:DUF3817 domain-containing protein n=1 Tax=Euzebyella marina TaxID=1761453 RepID=A0A3G2L4F0_9FLAO|nr:DUF3817 domain-containing protein [Euzebyella marina]AYN67137.1 DUF3817 domain-containing protein [Euzebyella marina]
MFKVFRLTAILEGISYLALFAVTMPLKYMADIPLPNKYVGYAHGILFIAYVILAIVFWFERKWSIKKGIVLLLASLLPFATFYVDQKYLQPAEA